jgi:hypothetical protein
MRGLDDHLIVDDGLPLQVGPRTAQRKPRLRWGRLQ